MFKLQSDATDAYQAMLAKERLENDALIAAEALLRKHGYIVTFLHDGEGAEEAVRERWRQAVQAAPCVPRINIGYDPEAAFIIALRSFQAEP